MTNKSKPTHKRIKRSKYYIINVRKKALLGIIDLLILNWVKKQPLCGQDIRNKIHREFDLNIGPGTMYPILYQLQNKGFIESKMYNKKKMYFLTKKGKALSTKAKKDYLKIDELILNFLKK